MTLATISVGGRVVGAGAAPWIIAEIGINHEGSVDLCAHMIEAAARAGADAVKLQTVDADENYMRGTESHALFSRAALTPEQTAAMFDLARRLGLQVFTTAGDFATLEWVDRLAPDAHKISSGLLTHLPLIDACARTGRPLLMSTGMAEWDAMHAGLDTARRAGARQIGLFHCVSLYPAPLDSLNLRAIGRMAETFATPVGFSDHSDGTEAAGLAVAAGAVMVEKHFTFDRARPSFDHGISVDPQGLADLVRRVHAADSALGHAARPLSPEEADKARRMHRILLTRTALPAGHSLTRCDVTFKRPVTGVTGLPPAAWADLEHRKLIRALPAETPLSVDDITP